jgi:hypothetical protein
MNQRDEEMFLTVLDVFAKTNPDLTLESSSDDLAKPIDLNKLHRGILFGLILSYFLGVLILSFECINKCYLYF